MKQFLILMILTTLVIVNECSNRKSKRGILPKHCKCDCECGANGCCNVIALGHGICGTYLDEGDLCLIRSKTSCGCKAGLECKYTSYFIKRCIGPTGSGSGPN